VNTDLSPLNASV